MSFAIVFTIDWQHQHFPYSLFVWIIWVCDAVKFVFVFVVFDYFPNIFILFKSPLIQSWLPTVPRIYSKFKFVDYSSFAAKLKQMLFHSNEIAIRLVLFLLHLIFFFSNIFGSVFRCLTRSFPVSSLSSCFLNHLNKSVHFPFPVFATKLQILKRRRCKYILLFSFVRNYAFCNSVKNANQERPRTTVFLGRRETEKAVKNISEGKRFSHILWKDIIVEIDAFILPRMSLSTKQWIYSVKEI